MPGLAVGIDYALFITSRFREERAPGSAPEEAAGLAVGTAGSAVVAVLTPREREMVVLVATGLSNQEIAERMFLSPFTVRAHVQRAMTKLDARDRAQLVVIACRTGLARAAPGSPGADQG
jgi:DNA-binding NarL/FixJ family response regulator